MILSAQSIRSYPDLVSPFCERTESHGLTYGLSPCGYDIRIRETVFLGGEVRFNLASSLEWFKIPYVICGLVKDKSTWARRGLAVQNTVIEPGWRGYLTLELSYHGDEDTIWIQPGTPIAQVLFCWLDQPTEMPYDGKYQDQPARPVGALT